MGGRRVCLGEGGGRMLLVVVCQRGVLLGEGRVLLEHGRWRVLDFYCTKKTNKEIITR